VAPINKIDRWENDFKLSRQLFNEANIEIDYYEI
jgi:hypothetical protein